MKLILHKLEMEPALTVQICSLLPTGGGPYVFGCLYGQSSQNGWCELTMYCTETGHPNWNAGYNDRVNCVYNAALQALIVLVESCSWKQC